MKKFSDFKIKPEISSMVGDKINIARVLNREILVTNYKLGPSKHQENSQCLHLEFEMNGNKHVLFTGGVILIQMIQKVPKGEFPFVTTIVKENEYYEFT
ncbi:hypothetical protein [Allomuricauda sp. ARW1Y1]|jgi:hypothetical protein|uniref:hypothetical protein n=1 Tax=Allomuricauda sp. ARW1Y1 TaxID=2663843 RepID=UPI0015C8B970|nr:hypothetical protein [Muricauda sp. ARW1Y1]NYJ27539.1 hypothetical protein [Muricauda sp. ARW1Y1]